MLPAVEPQQKAQSFARTVTYVNCPQVDSTRRSAAAAAAAPAAAVAAGGGVGVGLGGGVGVGVRSSSRRRVI